jgi:hypothetical protein
MRQEDGPTVNQEMTKYMIVYEREKYWYCFINSEIVTKCEETLVAILT